MSTMLTALGAATRRYRWPLLTVWFVALVAALWLGPSLRDSLSGGGWYVPGSDSAAVAQQLTRGFEGRGATTVTLVVRDSRHTAAEPAFTTRVRQVTEEVRRHSALQVSSSYGWATLNTPAREKFLGSDQRTVLLFVGSRLSDGDARRILPTVQADLDERYGAQGLQVSLVSPASLWGEINALSERGLLRAELLVLPLILIILLLLYRSVLAALLSLVVAVTAVAFTLGVLALLARRYELSVFVQNAAVMLGLGVGVDYALFVIARFREEASRDHPITEAVTRSLRTSGETVVASGVTILVAMSALFLVDLNVIRSLALGAVVVVAFAVLASIVILPAFLHVLGPRLVAARPAGRRYGRWRSAGRNRRSGDPHGRWARVAHRVMRRPVVFLVLSLLGLAALAVPSLRLATFTPDARIIPANSPVRVGYETVRSQFGIGYTSPIQVLVQSSTPLPQHSDAASLLDLHDRLGRLPGVIAVNSAVEPLRQVERRQPLAVLYPETFKRLPADLRSTVRHFVPEDNRSIVIEVIPDGYASSEEVRALLDTVRSQARVLTAGGWRVAVGGETAEGVAANAVISDRLPIVVAVMLLAIYLLLLLTFRSVFLPLKAILINLISVAATYGVLVLCFQDGWAAGLLGFEQSGHLTNFVPILLVTLLFSLSTDYEVFLLNRVREEYLSTGDNTASVVTGLSRTAPLISGAALLMVAVFTAFTFTSVLPIQQLGLGMAVAIALDATIIRLLVVPASMRLMARWNWWMPGRRPPQQTHAVIAVGSPQPEKAETP